MLIFDTTLRDGLKHKGLQLSLNEKIEIAQLLDQSGIEIIEIAYIGSKALDEEKTIAHAINVNKICVLTDTTLKNVERAIQFLKDTKGKILHIYSMANVTKGNRHERLRELEEAVKFASDHTEMIRWTGFDGNRAPYKIYKAQIKHAIDSGVHVVSIPDSLGVDSPDIFGELVLRIKEDFRNGMVEFSVHCHNDLGFALENSRRALERGIDQIEMTLNGIGNRKGNCNLLMFIKSQNLTEKYDTKLIEKAEKILK